MKFSYVRIVNNLFLCAAYIISVYCFTGTSLYRYFASFTSFAGFAFFIVNAAAAVFAAFRMISGKSVFYSMGVFSFILLAFCIIPVSKLDWVKTITGIRTESTAHTGMVAIAAFIALWSVLLSSMLKSHDNNIMELYKRGASAVEVRNVHEKQVRLLGCIFAGLLIPGITAIIIGFFVMSDQKGLFEPLTFLLAGTVAALLMVVFFLLTYRRK